MSKNEVVEPSLKSYVPRHIRLGVCCKLPVLLSFRDVLEEIPVIDEAGSVIETRSVLKRVPVSDVMSVFNVEDFRLSTMVKNGVPLNVVNVNNSSAFTIDQLERICQNIDNVESFVNKVAQEKAEKQSWFASFNESESVES